MSNVRSTPLTSSRKGAGGISIIGIIFLLIAIGPLFWLLNGGYSIQGMQWLAEHVGAYGRLFWQVATLVTINVPIAERAGLPTEQPVIPWLFVFGTSFLQIGLFVRRMRRAYLEPVLDISGAAVSLFDYITTMLGLMFASFAAGAALPARIAWYVLAIALAIPITFGFEVLLARAMRGTRHVRQPHS